MGISVRDVSQLSGKQKVAILLLSMSSENATKMFSLMNEEQITEISYVMSHLGVVSADVVDIVLQQVNDSIVGEDAYLGNMETTERLLMRVMDRDRVLALMEEIKGPQGKNTWEKLKNVNEDLLALYFRNEHPQTAALVLSKIAPDHASRVLSSLPDSFAFEIMGRILNLGNVKKGVLERVERILRAEFITSFSRTQKYDSFEMLAEIFNNFDRNNEVKFMTMLESNLPEAAVQIKDKMFTFDDLVRIDSKGVQRLLRDVEKSRLTVALKGASEEIKTLVFSNMSQRIAKIIQEDIQSMGAVRVRDVDVARAEIVSTAKRLIDEGEIGILIDNNEEFIT